MEKKRTVVGAVSSLFLWFPENYMASGRKGQEKSAPQRTAHCQRINKGNAEKKMSV